MSLLDNLRRLSIIPPLAEEEESKGDIHDVMRILDSFKHLRDVKRLYKVKIDYTEKKNSISLDFLMNDVRSKRDLEALLESEYFSDMKNKLRDVGVSEYFIGRISKSSQYHFDTQIKNMVLFRTDFINLF